MTFQDIFKSSFLEHIDSIPMLDMAIALALAFLMGLFLFFVYKKSYSGVMYSPSFGVTLVALCLITTLLIMTVISNVVLSLGMVGALSIVRFRTAIKEPMDIAFQDAQTEEEVRAVVETQVRRMVLKSKSVDSQCVELNYEVRLREGESGFVNELAGMEGVSHVTLVSYNGDYMG